MISNPLDETPRRPRLRTRATILLAVLLLLATAASPIVRFTSSAQKAPAIATPAAETPAVTAEVLETVSKLRNLAIKQPVKSGQKTHDEIEASVIQDLAETTKPEEFEASEKTLTRLGLIPQGFKLREFIVKLLREQVAGYYEPKTKIFYLAAWLPIAEQKTVMAHELTHALQDQHFDLRRFEKWPKGDSDAELAVHSLVEGEATLVMFLYAVAEGGGNLDLNRIGSLTERMLQQDGADAAQYPVLAQAPAVLRENLQFPYIYGVGFVQEVFKNRAWAGVSNCYAKLPLSSSQIMHPERFLAGEAPVKIELADLLPALGSGWRRADQDVNGEFGFKILMEQFVDKPRAALVASGWSGDRYALYENKSSGENVLASFTTWRTEPGARSVLDAYSDRTLARYHLKNPDFSDETSRLFSTSEGIVYLESKGSDVIMIEGAKDKDHAKAIARLMWQSKKK